MARYLPFALPVTRNVGRYNPLLSKRTVAIDIAVANNYGNSNACYSRWGNSSVCQIWDGSRKTFSTQIRSITSFRQSPLLNFSLGSPCIFEQKAQVRLELEQQKFLPIPSIPGMHALQPINESIRTFSTTSHKAGRSNKSPYETFYTGALKYSKRKRSGVIGQSNNNNSNINANTIDLIGNKKTQLKLRETKWKISKGVRSIRSRILVHNKKLHENLLEQKAKKNVFVRRLKRQLVQKTKREDIKTIPNLLTTLRMASVPILSYLVISDYYGCAFTIFVLAGFTDALDGYIARNFKNQRTAFGTALDPLADKLLISFLTMSLTVNGLIPVPLTALILSRDAGLVIASFYIRYISLAPPRTLARYFDFSHVTAKIYPSNISKINTGLQLSFVGCTLAAPVFDFVGSPWLQLLMYTTAATTFLSGADYVLTWRRRLKIIKNT